MRSRGDIILTLFLISVIYSFYPSNLLSVKGELSPFPRQEITDGVGEFVRLNFSDGSRQSPEQAKIGNLSNILGISHYSDGRTLNATLWLGGTVRKDPSQFGAKVLAYGVLVDIDSSVNTGKFGVDFQKEISWTNDTNDWTSSLIEYSSSGLHKAVIERSNLTDLEDKSFFPISIDLKSITSPSNFRVAYYAMLTYTGEQRIVDITSWIDVPPAQFSLLPLPDNLILMKGDTMEIGAQLVSNTGMLARVLNFVPEQNHSRIMVQFNPNGLNTSLFGVAPVPFRITVPSDADVGNYIIPISGNVSIESGRLGLPGTNVSIPGQSYFSIKPNLTVTVVNPPSFGDEFKAFWSSYGQVISLFGAGFMGGFSTHIMDRIKQRGKKDKT